MKKFAIWYRFKYTENTDPQHRCYHGVNFSEETRLSEWIRLYALDSQFDAEASAVSWRSLNPNTEYEVRAE